MRIAFVRTKKENTVFVDPQMAGSQFDEAMLERMKISTKAGSSSKNIILGLIQKGYVESCEEWKFWSGTEQQLLLPATVPVRLFPCDQDENSQALADHIRAAGEPDILWVEGRHFPPHMAQIFDLCPSSFKLVYSKDWRPWKVQNLHQYDLCLVDEDWEVETVSKKYPDLKCEVWDKFVDDRNEHYPLPLHKKYDLCYVAYLRERKNHRLLFEAMARLKERKLECVCVGDDRKGNRHELEKMVDELNLKVDFTGNVAKEEVNRYINQAKVGVMCSEADAVPRAILEYMAADVPVLVNQRLMAGARYIGAAAGLVKPPEEFHLGIRELLDNLPKYQPRKYYLENFSRDLVIDKFVNLLSRAGMNLASKTANRSAT